MKPTGKGHPCFDQGSAGGCGRVHLPVAPACNIQCNFCDRRYSCSNEGRPGVTEATLTPRQALAYLERVLERDPRITVAGIAGPGDPLANPATMETLALVHQRFPGLMPCVATNGLALPASVDGLAENGVTHVTVTVNAVDPAIGAGVYAWVRDGNVAYRGEAGARLLLERQLEGIRLLKARGIAVKVNSVIIPGVNDAHIPAIAGVMAELGADIMNCIPLIPVKGTPFGELAEPGPSMVRGIREAAGAHMPQMLHCGRCRADAAGLLGGDGAEDAACILRQVAAGPANPGEYRPNVAVASREGILVNLHLGEAERLHVFAPTGEGKGWRYLGTRRTPEAGGNGDRWERLSVELADCHTLLVANAGPSPKRVLAAKGLKVVETTGLIAELLAELAAGGELRHLPARPFKCGSSCKGTGLGCG